MESQKRILLAIGLSFAFVTLWSTFFAPKSPTTPAVQHDTVADAGASAIASPVASLPDAGVRGSAQIVPPEHQVPVIEVRRDFPKVRYGLTTEGAALTQAELQGRKMREQPRLSVAEGFGRVFGRKVPPPPQVDMARPIPGFPNPLSVSIEGAQALPAATRYRLAESDANDRTLVFTATVPGWEVTKTFEWIRDDGELLKLTVAIKNTASQPASGELAVHLARAIDPRDEEKPSMFGGVGNLSKSVCSVPDKVHRVGPEDKPITVDPSPLSFFGIDQQYFLAAVYPEPTAPGRCVLTATSTGREVSAHFPFVASPGQVLSQTFGVFVGAKDVEELAKIGAVGTDKGAAGPHLEKTVEFGWFGWMAAISTFLLFILKSFYAVFHNWGVAIICLTVVVKLAMLPLTHKSMMSAEQMKKLQPRMEEIRKKFAQDKERQNLEMMKLYQEAKVNPLGGCLPILIQMPVWFALFGALRNSYEIYGEPFIAPIWMDLTYKDPTYILPIALGITMILTQRLQPQMTMDKTQAMMMTYVMPGVFSLMMLNYPAGLSLYIFTNNLVSIGQQWLLKRYIKKKGEIVAGTPALGRNK